MTCSCGKEMERVPVWMSEIKIQFVCANCPNRTVQSIADVKIETPDGEPVKKKRSATK